MKYEMQPLDAKRLDNIFKIEMEDIGKFATQNSGSHNPQNIMQKMLTSELTGRRFYFKGLKASDKSQGTSGNTKFKGKNDK